MKKTGAYKNGKHLNSKFWQEKKQEIVSIPLDLREIIVGNLLGDATMYRVGINSKIKIDQGYKNKEYLFHLFSRANLYFKKNHT